MCITSHAEKCLPYKIERKKTERLNVKWAIYHLVIYLYITLGQNLKRNSHKTKTGTEFHSKLSNAAFICQQSPSSLIKTAKISKLNWWRSLWSLAAFSCFYTNWGPLCSIKKQAPDEPSVSLCPLAVLTI